MNIYEDIIAEINKGLEGKNNTIPFPIEGLEDYLEISKNTMYLLGGSTGSGKSTIAVEVFITGVINWYLKEKEKPDNTIKLSIMYFGMERKQVMLTAKLLSRFIFEEQGIEISAKKILGRTKDKLSLDEQQIVKTYAERFKTWQEDELFMCSEGSKNPTGIKVFIDNFAAKHGKVNNRGDGVLDDKTYVPNHPNHIVLPITDHIALLKAQKDATGNRKQRIDLFSETMRTARDLYGFSPVIVQQLNRSLSDVNRLKLGDTLPKLSDFAETSDTQNDTDVAISLLDPWRVLGNDADEDILRYKLKKLKDEKGRKFYRTMHILKNSYGADGISVPLAFHPVYGIFKKMPKPAALMQEQDYKSITSGEYFLS
jgi:hypothetical protein